MPCDIIFQNLFMKITLKEVYCCVYTNMLKFCTELNVIDCLSLIAMVKQKDSLITQENVIYDKIKHISSILATEIPSASVSDLQEELHW